MTMPGTPKWWREVGREDWTPCPPDLTLAPEQLASLRAMGLDDPLIEAKCAELAASWAHGECVALKRAARAAGNPTKERFWRRAAPEMWRGRLYSALLDFCSNIADRQRLVMHGPSYAEHCRKFRLPNEDTDAPWTRALPKENPVINTRDVPEYRVEVTHDGDTATLRTVSDARCFEVMIRPARPASGKLAWVPLDAIHLPRDVSHGNVDHVRAMAGALLQWCEGGGYPWPPIILGEIAGGRACIGDGQHRNVAARWLRFPVLLATLKAGAPPGSFDGSGFCYARRLEANDEQQAERGRQ